MSTLRLARPAGGRRKMGYYHIDFVSNDNCLAARMGLPVAFQRPSDDDVADLRRRIHESGIVKPRSPRTLAFLRLLRRLTRIRA